MTIWTGRVGRGVNVIRNDDFGPCAITEHFVVPGGLEGGSYSTFDRFSGRWRQLWVDNQDGTFTLVGGPVDGQAHRFELRTVDRVGQDRSFRRMIWEDVMSDSMTWRWQKLEDSGFWSDQWVLRYRRRGGP